MRQWVIHGSRGCYRDTLGTSEEPVKGQVSDSMLVNLSPCPSHRPPGHSSTPGVSHPVPHLSRPKVTGQQLTPPDPKYRPS